MSLKLMNQLVHLTPLHTVPQVCILNDYVTNHVTNQVIDPVTNASGFKLDTQSISFKLPKHQYSDTIITT